MLTFHILHGSWLKAIFGLQFFGRSHLKYRYQGIHNSAYTDILTVKRQKQIAVFKHFLMGNIIPKTHTAERSSVVHDQYHISVTK